MKSEIFAGHFIHCLLIALYDVMYVGMQYISMEREGFYVSDTCNNRPCDAKRKKKMRSSYSIHRVGVCTATGMFRSFISYVLVCRFMH